MVVVFKVVLVELPEEMKESCLMMGRKNDEKNLVRAMMMMMITRREKVR
jgi:hypothetical protein